VYKPAHLEKLLG